MEIGKDRKPCHALTANGSACQASAIDGSDYCFFHDPAKADERREAQSTGGKQNKMKVLADDVPDIAVRDCRDVVALVSETINQVRKGQIDPRVANAVGYLANVLIKAVEQGDIEQRIKELEDLVKIRTRSSDDLGLTGTD